MLRIRTGARHGLRWGMFGFVAAVFTISSHPTQAAPYADIVVDANSGTVLHSTNPDALRHPASLTKIMTLYLLFEQLEAGKLKLDTPLPVSAHAAGQTPTKLGLKPGQHARGRGRDQGHRHPLGERRRRRGRGGDRRRRERVRQADDAQGARARHEPHHLQERLRPAGQRPGHHGARPGHARPRHPGALPALLQIFLDPLVHLSRPVDRQPQSSARQGRRRRRHQDRLHQRLRLQPRDVGAPRQPLSRRGRHGRQQRGQPRRAHARPDRARRSRRPRPSAPHRWSPRPSDA